MDKYKELADNLRRVLGNKGVAISTGIVKSVSGILCEIEVGKLVVPDVRLRASETADDGEILLVPKVGTAVVFGSLTGDLSQLVVLQVDHVESIKVTGSISISGDITINDGNLGGMINIEDLTNKLNSLVDKFNNHTHMILTGGVVVDPSKFSNLSPISVPAIQSKADKFNKSDYEDTNIKH